MPILGNHSHRAFHSSRQSNLFKSSGFGAGGGSEEAKAAGDSADQPAEETQITKEEYEVSCPHVYADKMQSTRRIGKITTSTLCPSKFIHISPSFTSVLASPKAKLT